MLSAIKLENILSYDKGSDGGPVVFSLIPGRVRGKTDHIYKEAHFKALKFSAIYGGNASGKSNLIKAVQFIQNSLRHGISNDYMERYCKSIPGNVKKTSLIELEIYLDMHLYRYGFQILLSEKRIVKEWLYEVRPFGEKKIIFYRDVKRAHFEAGIRSSKSALLERIDTYAEDILTDDGALFLRVMNRNKKTLYEKNPEINILRAIYEWITEKLYVGMPDEPISDYSYLVQPENKQSAQNAINLVKQFATGITGFEMVEVPVDKVLHDLPDFVRRDITKKLEEHMLEVRREHGKRITGLFMRSRNQLFIISISPKEKLKCRTIEFKHGPDSPLFQLSEESDGTVRLFDLLEILLDTEGRTFLIDEFDRSLHPNLTQHFIKLFLDNAKSKNTQLIVTTHDVELMDLDLLRRDEIWFTQRKPNGTTELFSLDRYRTRFDKDIRTAYLKGAFEGVPRLE